MTITQVQLDALERAADKVFGKLGLDIEFTRHFLDRANDSRNGKQITVRELAELFVKEYQKWGKTIAKMPHSAQAVMKDLSSELNIPFVLEPDGSETDLIAKTVMRKKDFKTSNKELPVENIEEDIRDNFVSKKSLPEIMRLKTDKQLFADWKKYVLDAGIGGMVMSRKLKQIQQAIADEMKERRLLDRSKSYQFEEAHNPNLYYVQPDGSWKKGGDGRSKGRKRNEIPKGAKIVEAFNAQEYFKDYSDAKLLSVVSSGLGKEREHAKKEWERRKASGEKWRREDMTESTGQYYVIAKSPNWKRVHYIQDDGGYVYGRKAKATPFDKETAEQVAKATQGTANNWQTKVISADGAPVYEKTIKEAKLADAIPALEKELNEGAGFDRRVFQLEMQRKSRAPGPWGFGSAGGGIMIRWSTYGAKTLAEERGVDPQVVVKEARQYMTKWLKENTTPLTVRDRDSGETKDFYIKGPLAFNDETFYVRVNTKRMLQNKNRFEIKEDSVCWDGYEKVPGKRNYSKGSCRKKTANESAGKIACLSCDEVSTAKAWQKNSNTCPKCKKSSRGVAEAEVGDRVKYRNIKTKRNKSGTVDKVKKNKHGQKYYELRGSGKIVYDGDLEEEKHGAKKGTQVKGKSPTPKKSRPTAGNETPHPMRGKLVGEGAVRAAWESYKVDEKIVDPREAILKFALKLLDQKVKAGGDKQSLGGYAYEVGREVALGDIATPQELAGMYRAVMGESVITEGWMERNLYYLDEVMDPKTKRKKK